MGWEGGFELNSSIEYLCISLYKVEVLAGVLGKNSQKPYTQSRCILFAHSTLLSSTHYISPISNTFHTFSTLYSRIFFYKLLFLFVARTHRNKTSLIASSVKVCKIFSKNALELLQTLDEKSHLYGVCVYRRKNEYMLTYVTMHTRNVDVVSSKISGNGKRTDGKIQQIIKSKYIMRETIQTIQCTNIESDHMRK